MGLIDRLFGLEGFEITQEKNMTYKIKSIGSEQPPEELIEMAKHYLRTYYPNKRQTLMITHRE